MPNVCSKYDHPLQVLGSDLLKEGDIALLDLRYSESSEDTTAYYVYAGYRADF